MPRTLAGAVVRVEVRRELRVLRLQRHRRRDRRSDRGRRRASRAAPALRRPRARRGSCGAACAPTAFRIRIASIIAALPVALSVAPVAYGCESKCAPSMHDFSDARSVPGNLGDRVEAVRRGLVVELRLDVQLDLHRHALVEHADHAVVVLDGERDRRHALAGVVVARAAAGREDRAAVGMLLLPRQVAAARRHVAVAAAVEDGDDAFGLEELRDPFWRNARAPRPPRRRVRRAARAAAARRRDRRRRGFREVLVVHAQDDRPSSIRTGARRLRQHDLAGQLAAVFLEVRVARRSARGRRRR